jgi:hypothetical protein
MRTRYWTLLLCIIISQLDSDKASAQQPAFKWPQPGEVVTTRAQVPVSESIGVGSEPEVVAGNTVEEYELLPAPPYEQQIRANAILTTPENVAEPRYELDLDTGIGFTSEPDPELRNSVDYAQRDQEAPTVREAIGPSLNSETAFNEDSLEFCGEYFCDPVAAGHDLPARFFFGSQFTFLAPTSESEQRVSLTNLKTSGVYQESLETGLSGGTRFWAGIRSGNSGVVATGWLLRSETVDLPSDVRGKDEWGFTNAYDLDAATVDIELFQSFCFFNSELRATFGGRYAEMARTGLVNGFGDIGDTSVSGLAHGATELTGWGITTSFGGRTQMGFLRHFRGEYLHCYNPWFFVWNVRGSVLDAQVTASALTEARVSNNAKMPAIASSTDGSYGTWEGMVAIGGIQIGTEYRRPVHWCHGLFSVSTGFEGQYWQTGDVMAQSKSHAYLMSSAPLFGSRVESISDVNSDDLGLAGAYLRVGLEY